MPEYTEPLALPVPRPSIPWSVSWGKSPKRGPKYIEVLAFPNQLVSYALSSNFILPPALGFGDSVGEIVFFAFAYLPAIYFEEDFS